MYQIVDISKRVRNMKNWPVICVLALVSQTAGAITTEIPAGTVVNGGDVHTIVTQKFTA